jgi:hypothetical protein
MRTYRPRRCSASQAKVFCHIMDQGKAVFVGRGFSRDISQPFK